MVTNEPTPEPRLKMFIHRGCSVADDFKVEKPSLVQGLPKTAELRPSVGDEDLPANFSPSGHPGSIVEEKKRKIAPSSPSSEKKKTRRRLVRKPKKTSSSRVVDLESLLRLRDKPEEEEIFVAHDPSIPEEWVAAKGETLEANPPQASVFYHKNFLRYRDELSQLEAEVKELAKKRSMYELLSDQREEEVKSLRAELDAAQKEHADLLEQLKIFEVSDDEIDMVSNGQNPQVQQKVDRVDQLQVEMDEVNAMTEEWKGKMDRLPSEKKTAWERLASTEAQLRSIKEKAETRSQKIEDLQSQLGSALAARDTFTKDLEAAKLAAEILGPTLKRWWPSTKLMLRQIRNA
ncbi:GRIP domain-containing protein RUD3-like [Nicotiana tomentosiformis]|uniref:GRIP domain-containing protein RUD3-like n=1 Tax=Nicotiana tomentosiformis TaxID=4098 RepID=UPI00388C7BFC